MRADSRPDSRFKTTACLVGCCCWLVVVVVVMAPDLTHPLRLSPNKIGLRGKPLAPENEINTFHNEK